MQFRYYCAFVSSSCELHSIGGDCDGAVVVAILFAKTDVGSWSYETFLFCVFFRIHFFSLFFHIVYSSSTNNIANMNILAISSSLYRSFYVATLYALYVGNVCTYHSLLVKIRKSLCAIESLMVFLFFLLVFHLLSLLLRLFVLLLCFDLSIMLFFFSLLWLQPKSILSSLFRAFCFIFPFVSFFVYFVQSFGIFLEIAVGEIII